MFLTKKIINIKLINILIILIFFLLIKINFSAKIENGINNNKAIR